MQKNVVISIFISVLLITGAILLSSTKNSEGDNLSQGKNVEVREGVQYITVLARGGYSPRITQIKSGIPTKLIVKTNNTYDCSASLVIRSVGFQKILQSSGEEVIDLGIPNSGDKVQGVCGMGMYNFQIKVE